MNACCTLYWCLSCWGRRNLYRTYNSVIGLLRPIVIVNVEFGLLLVAIILSPFELPLVKQFYQDNKYGSVEKNLKIATRFFFRACCRHVNQKFFRFVKVKSPVFERGDEFRLLPRSVSITMVRTEYTNSRHDCTLDYEGFPFVLYDTWKVFFWM